RPVPFDGEHEFLVLGADAEVRLRLTALFEPRDEFLARFDWRHVDLVAGHAVFRPKGPRPYTAAAREGNRSSAMHERLNTRRLHLPGLILPCRRAGSNAHEALPLDHLAQPVEFLIDLRPGRQFLHVAEPALDVRIGRKVATDQLAEGHDAGAEIVGN